MARRYRARRARKYELLNYNYVKPITSTPNAYQYVQHTVNGTGVNFLTVVPPGTYAGVRKVKNFVISVGAAAPEASCTVLFRWLLVYLPQRTSTSNETMNTNSAESAAADMVQIYEPNQHIIASGTGVGDQGIRVRTSLARNLMNGDQIILMINYNPVTYEPSSSSLNVNFIINVQYALCYN